MQTESFRKLSPDATKAFLLLYERSGKYKVLRNFTIAKLRKLWNESPELKMPRSEIKVNAIIKELVENEFITYNKKSREIHMREVRNKNNPYKDYKLVGANEYINGIAPEDWWFKSLEGKTLRLRPATISDLLAVDGIHRSECENYLADKKGYVVPRVCVEEVA